MSNTKPFRVASSRSFPGKVLFGPDAPWWTRGLSGFIISGIHPPGILKDVCSRVVAALNAAEENQDRPWEGNGPSVAEVGGELILVRIEAGSLIQGRWDRSRWITFWGDPIKNFSPTGWRPMPRA